MGIPVPPVPGQKTIPDEWRWWQNLPFFVFFGILCPVAFLCFTVAVVYCVVMMMMGGGL